MTRRKPPERHRKAKLLGEFHAPRSQCDRRGKSAYPTRAAARTASAEMSKRYSTRQSYYRCPDCGLYHLTTVKAWPTRGTAQSQSERPVSSDHVAEAENTCQENST